MIQIFFTILKIVKTRMLERIVIVNYTTTKIDDDVSDRCYIIMWMCELHISQESIEMKGDKSPQSLFIRGIVCDTEFLNPVINARYRCTVIKKIMRRYV